MPINRRAFIKRSLACSISASIAGLSLPSFGVPTKASPQMPYPWHMPAETENHLLTWMAFSSPAGAPAAELGSQSLPAVQANILTIAKAIAETEMVVLIVRKSEKASVKEQLQKSTGNLAGTPVLDMDEFHAADLNDPVQRAHYRQFKLQPYVGLLAIDEVGGIWIRDNGAVFLLPPPQPSASAEYYRPVKEFSRQLPLRAVDFNGWGGKQAYQHDGKVAAFMAKQLSAELIKSSLVLEGGGFEVDGRGTAIAAESCILDNNRNPGLSKAQFEDTFMPLLGLEKIIWIPGSKNKGASCRHADSYARLVWPEHAWPSGFESAELAPQVFVHMEVDPATEEYDLCLQHKELLAAATNAQGKHLNVVPINAPAKPRLRGASDNRLAALGYVGYYVCNDAVIMPEFGDAEADNAAELALKEAFPNRIIKPLNIDAIAAVGGSIHRATLQQPEHRYR